MGSVFFHIDLDAFFASVEILDHPEYKGKPLIIGTPGERHVASTCSYEARLYGVHSAMPMNKALRLCPEAICVPGHYKRYSQMSKQVMSIIKDFAPNFLQVSIDEAFLDLTGMERIYPLPGKAARILKNKIYEETKLTVSIGVASSRYIAKLASDFHKPDGLTIVPPGKEECFIDAVGLKKLWGLGKASYDNLIKKGINSTASLRSLPHDYLKSMFGESFSDYLYKVVRGIDPGIYQSQIKNHSISTESTFYPDVFGLDVLNQYLLEMSQDLMFRALDEMQVAKTVGIKIRYGDFSTHTVQITPEEGIYSSEDVYELTKKLLKEKYNGNGVRLLGVFLTNLYKGKEIEQLEFFSEKKEKKRALEKTILSLTKKGNLVTKATLIKSTKDDNQKS